MSVRFQARTMSNVSKPMTQGSQEFDGDEDGEEEGSTTVVASGDEGGPALSKEEQERIR